jgi:superfamily II DNA or RNA helicase
MNGDRPESDAELVPLAPGRTPRRWQAEAMRSIRAYLPKHRAILVSAATGSGKGDLLASLIVKAARRGKRCLFLVHRDELIDDVMARALAIEPALYAGKVKGTQNEINRHAVFASVQSLRGKRLDTVGRFDFYFTDEAHHGGAAGYRKLYARIEEVNPRAKHIGFTATPFRNAGQGKTKGIGDVFEVLAYEYSLQDAINDGALCPIRCLRIETELDLSGVDPDDEDRVAKMVDTPERNAVAVQKYMEHGRTASGLAPAIAFCANVQHAINLAELLRASGVRAEAVWDSYLPAIPGGQPAAPDEPYDGPYPDEADERGMKHKAGPKRKAVKCPDRAGRIAAYQRGDLDVICNATLLTEGFDAPATRIVMLLRPTQSRGMFAQMVGRATRLSPGKAEGLILDFVANSESHDLASMADLTRPTKGVRIEVGATVRHRRLAELSEGVVTAIWSAEPIVIAPPLEPDPDGVDLAAREPEQADPELDYARVLWRAAPEAFERGEDSPDQAEGHTHRCRELVILRPPRTITELDIEPRVIGVSEFTVTLFGDPDAPDAARVGWYNYTTSKKEHVLITRGDGMSVLLQHAPAPKGSTAAPEWEAWLRFEGPTQHDIDRPPESLERIAVGEFHAVRTAASAKIRNPIDWKAGWLRDAASDRQIDALAKFGMNKGAITRGEASMLLELRIMRMLIQKATRPWLPRHDRRIDHAERDRQIGAMNAEQQQPARSAPTDGTEP